MCTRPWQFKWSTVPRPLRPSTPEACASSTIMMQLYFSARPQSSGSGAISPSIEKTPSVMISFFPRKFAFSCRMRSQSFTSLCLKTLIVAFECRDLLFQLHVQFHRAGNRSNCPGARAVPLHRVQRGLAQRLVGGQSQIVIRSEVDHFPPVENAYGFLLAFEHAQLRRHAFFAHLFQLVGEVLQGILFRCKRCGIRHDCAPNVDSAGESTILCQLVAVSKCLEGKAERPIRSARHAVRIQQDLSSKAPLKQREGVFEFVERSALAK